MPGIFGGIPLTLPSGIVTATTVANASNLSSQTIWLWASLRNRVGLNYQFALGSFSLSAAVELQITVNSTIFSDGEDARYVVISANTTNDPINAYQIADLSLYGSDQVTAIALPETISIDDDDQLVLNGSVATFSALAALPAIEGMIRTVIDEAAYYRYDGLAWVEWPYLPNCYVADILQGIGAFKRIAIVGDEDVIPLPDKVLAVDTVPIRLWYLNGVETSTPTVVTGDALSFRFTINGSTTTPAIEQLDYANIFDGLVYYTLLGYYELATRTLDTAVNGVGSELPWGVLNPIQVRDDLPGGWAAVYDVQFKFNEGQTKGRLAFGDTVAFKDFYPQGKTGNKSAVFALTGNTRYSSDAGRLRLLPGMREGGSATVEGYDFPSPYVADQLLTNVGLLDDTADQIVTINASIPDSIRYVTDPNQIRSTEAILAFISTSPGVGPYATASPVQAIAGTGNIIVAVNHPVDGAGNATVRVDYPDIIAGSLNARDTAIGDQVKIWLFDGTDYYDQGTFPAAPPSVSQNVLITSLGTNIGGSLPSSTGMGLFRPLASGISTSAGGSIPTGSYQAIVAYFYDTGNSYLTDISHSTVIGAYYPGLAAIPELKDSLASVIDTLGYWRSPAIDLAALRALPLEELIPNSVRLVYAETSLFVYDAANTDADDDKNIIKPTIITGAGRFVLLSGGLDTATATPGDMLVFDGTNVNFTQQNTIAGAELEFTSSPAAGQLVSSLISGNELRHRSSAPGVGTLTSTVRNYTSNPGGAALVEVSRSDSANSLFTEVKLTASAESSIELTTVNATGSIDRTATLDNIKLDLFDNNTSRRARMAINGGLLHFSGTGDVAVHSYDQSYVYNYAGASFKGIDIRHSTIAGSMDNGAGIVSSVDLRWDNTNPGLDFSHDDGTVLTEAQLDVTNSLFSLYAQLPGPTMTTEFNNNLGTLLIQSVDADIKTFQVDVINERVELSRDGDNGINGEITIESNNPKIRMVYADGLTPINSTIQINNDNYGAYLYGKYDDIAGGYENGFFLESWNGGSFSSTYPAYGEYRSDISPFSISTRFTPNTGAIIRARLQSDSTEAGVFVENLDLAEGSHLTWENLQFNGVPVVTGQQTAVGDLALTFTANAPSFTADQASVIADGSAPTTVELLELCQELKAQIDDLKLQLANHGLIQY